METEIEIKFLGINPQTFRKKQKIPVNRDF